MILIIKKPNKQPAFTQNCVNAFFIGCEKSRIIKCRSPPARIWEFYQFSNSSRGRLYKIFFKKPKLLPSAVLIGGGFYMQTIKYTFADGTTNEVEVTEDIYLIHLELLLQEKRNHWRETRRHTSLYYFTDMGIAFEDKRTESPLELYIRKENIASIRKAMLYLTDKRRELIRKAFFEEKTFRAIAREQGLSKSAISQQMKTVYKHLRKHLGA